MSISYTYLYTPYKHHYIYTISYIIVERVCRDSTVYDPVEVKKFLMEAKLPDPRPLIHVCDRFDFVDEMTAYLFQNSLVKYIEVRICSCNLCL